MKILELLVSKDAASFPGHGLGTSLAGIDVFKVGIKSLPGSI